MRKMVLIKVGRYAFDVRPVIYAIMMAPFFEPLTISTFIAEGINASFFGAVAGLYTVGRLTVSTYAYLCLFRTRRIAKTWFSDAAAWSGLYLVMQAAATLLNQTFTINVLSGLYSYIGFLLLCVQIQRRSPEMFLRSVAMLFGTMTLIGVVTIVLFPDGFNHAPVKAYAHYALGSKNSSFFYFFYFVFAWLTYSMSLYGKRPRGSSVCMAVLILAAYICDSGNSMVCLSLVMAFHLLGQYGKRLFRYVRPMRLLAVLLVCMVVVYTGMNLPVLSTVAGSLGRDMTFTGRDALWADAIGQFMTSPICGTGQNAVFLLLTGVEATHAHSFYLDTMAKYGLIAAVPLFVSLFCAVSMATKFRDRLLGNQVGVFLFVAMLHMVFDVPGNYFYLLLLMIPHAAAIAQRKKHSAAKPEALS